MDNYIYSILTISIVGSVIGSIISSANPLKKHLNYLCSLILVITLISPLVSVLKNTFDIKEYINNFYHSIKTEEIIENSNTIIVNTSKEKVCEGIKETIISKFSLEKTDVYVSLELNSDDITSIEITKVNVILTNKASWSDTDKIKSFLSELLSCPIDVTRR